MAFVTVTSSGCELIDKKKYHKYRMEYKMMYAVLLFLGYQYNSLRLRANLAELEWHLFKAERSSTQQFSTLLC